MELSKNTIKFINSLKDKKARIEHSTFVIEGKKMISDLANKGANIKSIYVSNQESDFLTLIPEQYANKIIEVKANDFERISLLKSPQGVLALLEIPEQKFEISKLQNKLILILDNIQDPGNLGTIIRTADWFGINNIIASPTTVDVYNHKVIQASMGAFLSVEVIYTELKAFAIEYKKQCKHKIYGTLLNGENIYNTKLEKYGAIVIGNEGKGVSHELINEFDQALNLPSFSENLASESLNAAVACSIVCSEFKRR